MSEASSGDPTLAAEYNKQLDAEELRIHQKVLPLSGKG